MAVKVAINGFGRIGRLAFRQMFEADGYEVVAINDLTSPAMLAHLLKYDTAQGSFCGKIGEGKHTVESTEDSIIVDGKEIKIYAVKDAKDAPWGELNVDVVLECTGFYTSKAKSMAHIEAGAKKVVISAPAGNDLKTIVYSVNEKTLTSEDQVISAASCTTNCLAPMADTLNKTFPIVSGIMTTVHAYTGDQMILDGPQRKGDLRRARAGAQNIVPNSTGAAKAIGLVIPELNGKLIGSAQRVPVPTGSTTILVAVVKGKDITKESINAAMKAAATESYGYNEEEIVSSDVIGMKYGSLFDATQTMVTKIDDDTYQVQVVSWYDNENSYTSQILLGNIDAVVALHIAVEGPSQHAGLNQLTQRPVAALHPQRERHDDLAAGGVRRGLHLPGILQSRTKGLFADDVADARVNGGQQRILMIRVLRGNDGHVHIALLKHLPGIGVHFDAGMSCNEFLHLRFIEITDGNQLRLGILDLGIGMALAEDSHSYHGKFFEWALHLTFASFRILSPAARQEAVACAMLC